MVAPELARRLNRRARWWTACRATSWRWRCRWMWTRSSRRGSSPPTGARGCQIRRSSRRALSPSSRGRGNPKGVRGWDDLTRCACTHAWSRMRVLCCMRLSLRAQQVRPSVLACNGPHLQSNAPGSCMASRPTCTQRSMLPAVEQWQHRVSCMHVGRQGFSRGVLRGVQGCCVGGPFQAGRGCHHGEP